MSVFQTLTDSFTDGLNPSAFDSSCHNYRRIYRRIYSVGISNTHRLIYRRTESVGIWHTYRWIYRRIYSFGISNTHRKIYRRYISVGKSRYHRRNKNPSVYFKRKTFFWRANSVCKTIRKWFFCFSDRYSDGRGNHRRKKSRRTYSVGDYVGKKITDELLITHRRNIFVGKTVKSCSGT